MAGLSALPPELVSNIFAFVRKNSDRKRCYLVSRMFHDLMQPILLRVLSLDMVHDNESFDILVQPKSNVIPNAKSIKISRKDHSSKHMKLLWERLMVLVAALPRDELRRLRSSVPLDSNMVRVLLQSQELLKDIYFPLCESLSERVAWTPYLTAVEYVSCWLVGDATEAAMNFKNHWPLLQQSPKLACLTILSDSKEYTDIGLLQWPEVNGKAQKHVLTRLNLGGLDLGNHHTRISDHIDFEKLASLNLHLCWGCQPMLKALTTTYATGTCVLKDLSIYLPQGAADGAEKVYGAISGLLLSFTGLVTLFLNVGPLSLVSTASVINHHRTLKCLGIATCRPRRESYRVAALTTILNRCTGITQLGVNIGLTNTRWEGLCHNILDFDRSNTGGACTNKARDMLLAIARHPRLHSFRVMDPAFLDWNSNGTSFRWTNDPLPTKHLEVAAASLQNLASQIFQLMCQNGSNIRALAWIPTWLPMKYEPPVDSNGHHWPGYAYFKGHLVDAHGVDKVVAVPIDNIHHEMIESSIFYMS